MKMINRMCKYFKHTKLRTVADNFLGNSKHPYIKKFPKFSINPNSGLMSTKFHCVNTHTDYYKNNDFTMTEIRNAVNRGNETLI